MENGSEYVKEGDMKMVKWSIAGMEALAKKGINLVSPVLHHFFQFVQFEDNFLTSAVIVSLSSQDLSPFHSTFNTLLNNFNRFAAKVSSNP